MANALLATATKKTDYPKTHDPRPNQSSLRTMSSHDIDREALRGLGWRDSLEQQLPTLAPEGLDGRLVGRVVLELRGVLQVATATGDVSARIPGRMFHEAKTGGEIPTVGDWVLVSPPQRPGDEGWIDRLFDRFSKFSRQAAGGRTKEQVVAANVDRLFVVMGLDGDFQPRRIERYLSTIQQGGATAVILLNKVDLSTDPEAQRREIEAVAGDVPVHLLSAKYDDALEAIGRYLEPGMTIALVGSSGVGKSTILNRLAGQDLMRTSQVRASDDRGRHTTSHRQLLTLPDGALLMDNPGIRELQLWDSQDGIEETFSEITDLAEQCRFGDCQHQEEPGCAVQAALKEGTLSKSRLRSYWKLHKEQSAQTDRQREQLRSRDKHFTKSVHKAMRDKARQNSFES